MRDRCDSLNTCGWVSFVVLLILIFPLFWIPFCCAECHQDSQMPVYGFPPQQNNNMVIVNTR